MGRQSSTKTIIALAIALIIGIIGAQATDSQSLSERAKSETAAEFLSNSQASSSSSLKAAAQTSAASSSSSLKTINQSSTSSAPTPFTLSDSETFALYYVSDEIDLDASYLSNRANFAKINDYLARSPQIDSIVIYSYASPEGVYERNVWLAKRRAESAKRYILAHRGKSSKLKSRDIKLRPQGENWAGLEQEIQTSYHRSDREQVLRILHNTKIGGDTKKWRLKQLDGGKTWRHIIRTHMPKLRVATWVCVWVNPDALIPEPEPIVLEIEEPISVPIETISLLPTEIEALPILPRYEDRTIVALKTNLLYDAITALNAEIEVPIGRHFSIMVEDVFPWWTWGPNGKKYAFQMWEIGAEPRWWFVRTPERDRLSGHFLGVYMMSAKYDFQNDFDLCYQGEYWSAGISYGYSLPVGKHCNMEFSLSLGYVNADYRHYSPDPAYEHLYRDKYRVGVLSYYGPTKLKVSFVVPITVRRRIR